MTATGKVFLIGAGPGAADLLTLRALDMLRRADVVVHDRLVGDDILRMIPARTRMIPVGKAPGHHILPQARINELLYELARQGLTVARLKGGDPMIFGRGSEEAAYLAARGIAVEYAPGITAAQGMAAATGVPLTHRGLASGVRYVTGHRAGDARLDLDWKSLACEDTTLVIYMGAANIAEIALELLRAGLPGSLPVLAISGVTTAREARLLSRLDRIGLDMAERPLAAPVLFVIGHVVSLYRGAAAAAPEAAPDMPARACIAGE
ncbi:MAG: hypothetical protein Kow0058_12590 [Roseovarius sp.]